MAISLNTAMLLNGTGIDVASIVDQLLTQRSGQLTVWQDQLATLQTQAAALNTINTDLTNLQTAVNALGDPLGALTAMSADSSIPGILTASANMLAISGSHTIVVSGLASAGTVYTQPIAGGANASILPTGATGGDLKLQIGGAGGSVKDIPISVGSNDTLTKLVAYINQQSSANKWGVTASVLTDANGSRLAIYSQQTGAPGALAITANTTYGILNTADIAGADSTILPDGQSTGDIQLQVGGSGGTAYDIPITSGTNDTLNTLATYINDQSQQNNWGITANVVSDSGGFHLSLTTTATGPAGALAFTSNDTILSTSVPATNLTFQPPIGGTNASFTIDGIPYASTTNKITDALPGVTMNLVSAEPDIPLQLTIGPDTTQASNAINAFVIAYNTLITAINHQFTVDPSTNNEGPLGSDNSLHNMQSRILQDAAYKFASTGTFVNLRSAGITTNDDGTLSVNNTTLNDAMTNNWSALLNFFQNSGSTGFANNFSNDLIHLMSPTTGTINLDIAQNTAQQKSIQDEMNTFQDQLAVRKQLLTKQFSQVNAILQQYPYLQSAVTTQIDLLFGKNSSNSSS